MAAEPSSYVNGGGCQVKKRIPDFYRATLLKKVFTTAAGAVGKVYTNLASAEVRALLAVLAWRAGTLDEAGKVRPLGEWA